MIILQHVHKAYGRHQVLSDVDATISPGMVTGIVGANGAGKTTLFRCMADLEPYEGDISYRGETLRPHLGYVPTQPFYLSRLTAREYLQLLLVANSLPVPDLEQRNIFTLPLDNYASTFSTGMQKKLAIWGVLLLQKPVYILDEPFNGVDIESNMLLTEVILRLKAQGKTIVLSSHIFSTLRDICDVIYHLEEGTFRQKVERDQFDALDQAMRKVHIGTRLDRFFEEE